MTLKNPEAVRLFGTEEEQNRLIEQSHISIRELVSKQKVYDFVLILKQWGLKNCRASSAMLSTIFNHQLLYSKGENQYVQINTNSWQNAMSGAKRKEIKYYLKKKKIIEFDPHYTPNEKSQNYRFNKAFYKNFIIPFSSNPVTTNKPKNWTPTERIQDRSLVTEEQGFVLDAMGTNVLQLDYNEELAVELFLNQVEGDDRSEALFNEAFRPLVYKKEMANNVQMLKDRFFGSFNRFPRKFRSPIFHISGEEIISLDIKSCHPTFCLVFYLDESEDEILEHRKLESWIEKGFYKVLQRKTFKALRNTRAVNYIPDNREGAKEDFMKGLNSEEWSRDKIRKTKVGPHCWNIFCEHFPILYNRLEIEVKSNQELYRSKSNQLCVGCGLFSLEMKVMLPVYLQLISRGIWFYPEHDGLAILKKDMEFAETLLVDSLNHNIGYGLVSKKRWKDQEPLYS